MADEIVEGKTDESIVSDSGNLDTAVVDAGNSGLALPATVRHTLAIYTHKASVNLAYCVSLLAVCFDFWAQINGKPYQLHDWIVGLVLIPLGGFGMELFKEWLRRRK